jgi:iron complex transport system substrate-binding protein
MRLIRALLPLLALYGGPVAAKPRIVSLNPCIDAILVRVADPDQIAGISSYSQDPAATSIPIDLARRFHATSGTAEEVIALKPDLVIAGPHVSPATLNALQRLGIRLLKLPPPNSIAENESQIGRIADAAGSPDRGDALVRQIEAALKTSSPHDPRRIPALIWQGGGLVPGRGTLIDELLTRTGFENLSSSYGLQQWDVLPLELLVARPPSLLLSSGTSNGLGDRMLHHPVLVRLAKHMEIRRFPFRLLQCGGPTIIETVQRLAALRRSVPAS